MQEEHEAEGGIVGGVGHEGADGFVHHEAAERAAGGDDAERKRERAAGNEIDDEGAEVDEPREMREHGDHTESEDEPQGVDVRDRGAERDESGAAEHDPQAAADRGGAARDEQAGEPAAGEDADIGGEVNDPRDAEGFLVETARVIEIFGEPELEKIPDGVGQHAGEDEEHDLAAEEDLMPLTPVGSRGGDCGRGRGSGCFGGLTGFDHGAFLGGEAGVFARAAIKPEPRDQPEEAGRAGDDEGGLPTVPRGEADDEDGREGRTDRGTERVDADGEAAFAGGEPFRDGFGCGGPVARFAETEEKPTRGEGTERAREARENVGEGPPADEEGETEADAEAIHDFPGEDQGEGVGDQKPVEDGGVVLVGEREVLLDGRREDRERLTVDVVEDRGAEDQRDDPPAEIRDARHES